MTRQLIRRPLIAHCLLSALLWLAGSTAAVAQHGHEGHAGHEGHGAAGDEHAAHRAALAKKPDAKEIDALSIPNLALLDQEGREVHFYDDLVKDRTVAVSFIYTTCTTICPPIGANFGKLEKELGARAGRDVFLISVSVDPVTDTPERLKAWGQTFGAGPGWTLVTGPKRDVDRLLKALQVFTPDYEDHTPTLLLGNDSTGEWTRTYGLTPPDRLATMLEELAGGEDAAEVAEEVGR